MPVIQGRLGPLDTLLLPALRPGLTPASKQLLAGQPDVPWVLPPLPGTGLHARHRAEGEGWGSPKPGQLDERTPTPCLSPSVEGRQCPQGGAVRRGLGGSGAGKGSGVDYLTAGPSSASPSTRSPAPPAPPTWPGSHAGGLASQWSAEIERLWDRLLQGRPAPCLSSPDSALLEALRPFDPSSFPSANAPYARPTLPYAVPAPATLGLAWPLGHPAWSVATGWYTAALLAAGEATMLCLERAQDRVPVASARHPIPAWPWWAQLR